MNDFELSLLYDRLDKLVENEEMTESEAREEWREFTVGRSNYEVD